MNFAAKKNPPTETNTRGSGSVTSGLATLATNDMAVAASSTNAAAGFGTPSDRLSPELTVMLQDKAVADLFSAVDMLPDTRKRSFLKAREKCPNLIAAETTPSLFLQHDNYNLWKAAERLACHWEEREKVFGDRAFLPMTQTGNGALTKEDVVTLHTGSHAKLADTLSGQPVIFTDRRRILSTSDRQSRTRSFWYMASMMAKEKNAQSRGILHPVLVVTPRLSPLDFTVMKRGVDIMNVMPVTFHLHLLGMVSKSGKWGAAHALLQSVVNYCMVAFGGLDVYTETEQIGLLEKLISLGCIKEGLPVSIGGTWKYEEFTKWCRNKITEELYFEDAHLPKDKPQKTRNMTVERKKQRTKCLNVIHSRQKRERRKAEQSKMEEDCRKLQSQKWALQHENRRLEGLLAQAWKFVEQCEGRSFNTNWFDSIHPNTFSSVPHIPPHSAPNPLPRDDRVEASLMDSLATQQHIGLHPRGQSMKLRTSHTAVGLDPSNQVGEQMNLMNNQRFYASRTPGPNQTNMLQQSFGQHMMNQQVSRLPNSSDSRHDAMSQTSQQYSANQHPSLNFPPEQAMMHAIAMQNTLYPTMNESMGQTVHNRSQHRDMGYSVSNQFNSDMLPNMPFSAGSDLAPSPLGNSNVDPFAPLDAHIEAMVPNGATSVPSSFSVNRGASFRESAPREYAAFEIPEPDPLPETPLGIPTYQARRGNFPM